MGILYIDDRPVEFQEGDNVLEAATRAGIEVPYFCYHPALGAVGSCRACAMETVPQKEGERPRVVMSCTIKAAEGIRFSLMSDKSKQVQKNVVEFYMTNHPNDCPVCDEGGDCHLQNMTVLSGHAYRRYEGTKKTAPNQPLGPLVWNTANRCITCYRCVRFYQEYALGDDFGVMGSRNNVSFRRTDDGAFDSPFAGNLITVCPTGTFTDKVFRRKYSRTWMLDKGDSICNHCSVGCHVEIAGRHGTLRQVTPRESKSVNRHFICDRGRYAPHAAEAKNRPLTVYKKGQKLVDGDAGKLFKHFLQRGAKAAILGSCREDLIAGLTLRQLAHEIKAPFSPFADPELERRTKVAVSLSHNAPSLPDIEQSDCIVVIGELTEHAPMMELAVRQALKRNQSVFMLHAAPSILAKLLNKYPSAQAALQGPAQWGEALEQIASNQETFKHWGECLTQAQHPVILGVAELMDDTAMQAAKTLAERYSAKLGFALPEAGSFAASLLAKADSSEDLLLGIESGNIESLLVVNNDPLSAPNAKRWHNALGKLKELVVIDSIMSETAKQADLLLPAAAMGERSGLQINYEGRIQAFKQAYQREEALFRAEQLKQSLTHVAQNAIDTQLTEFVLDSPSTKGSGVLLSFAKIQTLLKLNQRPSTITAVADKTLHLVQRRWHGAESVANFSHELTSLSPEDRVQLSAQLAKSMNINPSDRLILKGAQDQITLAVTIQPDVAPYSLAVSVKSLATLGSYPTQSVQIEIAPPLYKDACIGETEGETS